MATYLLLCFTVNSFNVIDFFFGNSTEGLIRVSHNRSFEGKAILSFGYPEALLQSILAWRSQLTCINISRKHVLCEIRRVPRSIWARLAYGRQQTCPLSRNSQVAFL